MADKWGQGYNKRDTAFFSDDDPLSALARIGGDQHDPEGAPKDDFGFDLEGELLRSIATDRANAPAADNAAAADNAPTADNEPAVDSEDRALAAGEQDDLTIRDIPAFLRGGRVEDGERRAPEVENPEIEHSEPEPGVAAVDAHREADRRTGDAPAPDRAFEFDEDLTDLPDWRADVRRPPAATLQQEPTSEIPPETADVFNQPIELQLSEEDLRIDEALHVELGNTDRQSEEFEWEADGARSNAEIARSHDALDLSVPDASPSAEIHEFQSADSPVSPDLPVKEYATATTEDSETDPVLAELTRYAVPPPSGFRAASATQTDERSVDAAARAGDLEADLQAAFAELAAHPAASDFPEDATNGASGAAFGAAPDDGEIEFDFEDFESELRDAARSALELDTGAADVEPEVLPPPRQWREEPAFAAPNAAVPPDERFDDAPEFFATEPTPRVDLPFDAEEVADIGAMVEPIGELNVPELSLDDAPPRRDDFDMLDIEAEFAAILSDGPVAPAAPDPAAGRSPSQAGTGTVDYGQIDFADYDFSEPRPEPRNDPGARNNSHRDDTYHDDGTFEFADLGEPEDGARSPRVRAERAIRALPGWKVLAGGGVVLAVAALSGLALLGGGEAVSDEPRIIAASEEPLKVVPEDRGGRTVPNQNQAVYEQVDGTDTGDVTLVSRSEQPVDVVQRTLDPQVLPLKGRPDEPDLSEEGLEGSDGNADAVDGEAAAIEDLASLLADESLRPQVADPAARFGVEPRRVRTTTVRPDGTIVPVGEPAANEPAANETQSLAEAPSDRVADSGQLTAGLQPATATDALAPGTGADASGAALAPVPPQRPSDQPADVVGNAAAATPAETPSEDVGETETAALSGEAEAFTNPGGYVVQIASQPSEESARSTYENLSARYDSILGGRPVQIQAAEIPDRGTFYRVRIAGGTRDEAVALCERYQAAGGSCFVAR